MATNTRVISASTATCELCSEFFSDPRLLPCLHSFCYSCLQKHIKANECADTPSCPTCNEAFQVPEGTLAALPKDLRKNYEVEVAQYEAKIDSDKGVSCDRCIASADNMAICFCCSCCKFLCSKCKEDHLRWKETFEHELVNVGKDKEQGSKCLMDNLPHKINFCPEHEDESLKFYCETCSKLICRDCIILSHYEHKRDRIEHVAKKEKQDLDLLLEKVDSAVEELESSLSQGEKTLQRIQQKKRSADQNIREEFRKLHESIEMREKNLLKRITEICIEKETALRLQQEPMVCTQEHLKAMAIEIREAIGYYTAAELLSVQKTMKAKLENALQKVSSLQLHPCKTDTVLATFPIPLTNEIENFGVVTGGCCARNSTASLHTLQAIEGEEKKFVITAKDATANDYGYGGNFVIAQLKLLDSNECINGDVQDNKDGTYTVSITPCSVGDHVLSIMIENEHIQSSPFVIYVRKPRIYSNLRIQKQFLLPGSLPCYVAVNDSSIFVTNRSHYVRVFDKLTATQTNNIDLGSRFYITGITCYGNLVFISNCSQKCLHKVTPDGKILSTFGNNINDPYGLCVSVDGLIYVAEKSGGRICVFEIDGSLKKYITGNMKSPYDVAIDPSGNLHVANYGNHNIAVFTPQGEFMKHYGKGQVRNPVGIDIGPDGYIFVSECQSTESRLLIFDQHCRLHSSLLKGSLNNGFGVALDKNGDVYVCDYSNNRTLQL